MWRPGSPVEVLFDLVRRENGITHLLTQPRSPTTMGKIERFHRSLRAEFRTDRVFKSLTFAQAELDEWVEDYNQHRPHQAIAMATPAERFAERFAQSSRERGVVDLDGLRHDRSGEEWVARRASAAGVVSVSWQQVCLGKAAAGHNIDVRVGAEVLQGWDGDRLLRTVKRDRSGTVRTKRASIPGVRASSGQGVSRINRTRSVTHQPKLFIPGQAVRGMDPGRPRRQDRGGRAAGPRRDRASGAHPT